MNLDGNENEMTVANNYVTAEQIAVHRWSPITELPAIFFAKVGAAVMLNRKRLCRFPFLLDNNTMAYSLGSTKWDADFAKALFGTVDLTSLVQVGALPSYNAGDVESMEIYLPSLLEQEQIGGFFKQLDTLITLHQRQPFLHSPPDISLIVQLTPPFYTFSWEQRKLGDMMNVTSVKRIHQSDWTDSGVMFLRARDIVAAAKNEEPDDYLYISKEKYEEYSALSGKVGVSDLLVTGVGTIGVPYLVRNLEPLYFKDGNIIWFQNSDKIDGKFLFYSFSAEQIQGFINESAGIGTVGTYTIESGKKTPISLPNQIEQAKVGEFFQQLDNLITLHQRKFEKLTNVKKSMLEKMFPQNGSSYPEIRFKGFTDPWEQRKLGDISEIKTGPFGSTLHADDYVSDGTPIITTEHFKTGALPRSKNGLPQVSDSDYKRLTAYTLDDGDIVFSRVGSVDINALITPFQSNWLFSGRVLRVRPQTDISSKFLHTRLETESIKTDIRTRAVGQTMPSINTEILKITPLVLPSSAAEQEQIGSYFAALDNLITLHQRELEKLQNIKKSMLEKMFV